MQNHPVDVAQLLRGACIVHPNVWMAKPIWMATPVSRGALALSRPDRHVGTVALSIEQLVYVFGRLAAVLRDLKELKVVHGGICSESIGILHAPLTPKLVFGARNGSSDEKALMQVFAEALGKFHTKEAHNLICWAQQAESYEQMISKLGGKNPTPVVLGRPLVVLCSEGASAAAQMITRDKHALAPFFTAKGLFDGELPPLED